MQTCVRDSKITFKEIGDTEIKLLQITDNFVFFSFRGFCLVVIFYNFFILINVHTHFSNILNIKDTALS